MPCGGDLNITYAHCGSRFTLGVRSHDGAFERYGNVSVMDGRKDVRDVLAGAIADIIKEHIYSKKGVICLETVEK